MIDPYSNQCLNNECIVVRLPRPREGWLDATPLDSPMSENWCVFDAVPDPI